MAGVNLREGTMEGSLRAVDRTVSAVAEILVGFNVFPRYRDEDIEGDFCIQEVMFELVADIF